MKIKVEVFLKEGILDPQGKAILQAAQSLGYGNFTQVRAGKVFLLETQHDEKEKGLAEARSLGEKLLANPVIEDLQVTFME